MPVVQEDYLIKLKRFIQLSCEFSIKKSEVFETPSKFLVVNGKQKPNKINTLDPFSVYETFDVEECTAESYKEIMQEQIEKAYRFEEYKNLLSFFYYSEELKEL